MSGPIFIGTSRRSRRSREYSHESYPRGGDDYDAGWACLRAGKTDSEIREEDKAKTAVEKEADKAAERAYQRSLGNIPDKGSSTDPWGIARSTDAPKAAAKTPTAKKPSTKNGSTAN
jgi:hypothetical protein